MLRVALLGPVLALSSALLVSAPSMAAAATTANGGCSSPSQNLNRAIDQGRTSGGRSTPPVGGSSPAGMYSPRAPAAGAAGGRAGQYPPGAPPSQPRGGAAPGRAASSPGSESTPRPRGGPPGQGAAPGRSGPSSDRGPPPGERSAGRPGAPRPPQEPRPAKPAAGPTLPPTPKEIGINRFETGFGGRITAKETRTDTARGTKVRRVEYGLFGTPKVAYEYYVPRRR
jgi:hypothetical protein